MTKFEKFFEGKEFNWKPGLERVKGAVEEFGGKGYPSVIVPGTNGKGSTAVLTAEALVRQGFAVGLFTSPHVNFSSFSSLLQAGKEIIVPMFVGGIFLGAIFSVLSYFGVKKLLTKEVKAIKGYVGRLREDLAGENQKAN